MSALAVREISQMQKDKHCMISLYVESKQKQLRGTEKGLVVRVQESGWRAWLNRMKRVQGANSWLQTK